ncbi:hypothetical protein BGZ73_005633 [Actinomortierella ambigua]|nr:hypothetical protein BGZ73_005633 [Actinomortierella ambigua]
MGAPSPPTPIEIVELTERIAFHLLPSERARCLRVSKAWHQAFVPHLYYEVELDDRALDRILRYPTYPQSLERHGHLTRRVVQPLLFGSAGLDPALDTLRRIVVDRCSCLTHLSYHEMNDPTAGERTLMRLLAANTSTLSALSISLCGIMSSQKVANCFAICPPPDLLDPQKLVQDFIPFSGLESLTLSLEGYPSFGLLVFILQRCPRLLHLELQKRSKAEIVVLPEDFRRRISTSPEALTFRLQTLKVEQPGQCVAIPQLLRCCPSLTGLVLPPCSEELLVEICTALREASSASSTATSAKSPSLPLHPHSPLGNTTTTTSESVLSSMVPRHPDMQRITSLTLSRSDKFSDHFLEEVLRCFPPNQLEHLEFTHTGAGALTMAVILEHQLIPLQTLRLVSSLTGITSDHVLTLLSKGQRLRVLEISAEISHSTHLYVEDLLRQPWQCQDLEVFCVGIHGVCDPAQRPALQQRLRHEHVQRRQLRQLRQEQRQHRRQRQQQQQHQQHHYHYHHQQQGQQEQESSQQPQQQEQQQPPRMIHRKSMPAATVSPFSQSPTSLSILRTEWDDSTTTPSERVNTLLPYFARLSKPAPAPSAPEPKPLPLASSSPTLLSTMASSPAGTATSTTTTTTTTMRVAMHDVQKHLAYIKRQRELLAEDQAVEFGCQVHHVQTESRFYAQLAQLLRLREINTWCRGCARVRGQEAIDNLLAWELQLAMPMPVPARSKTMDAMLYSLGDDEDEDGEDEGGENGGDEDEDGDGGRRWGYGDSGGDVDDEIDDVYSQDDDNESNYSQHSDEANDHPTYGYLARRSSLTTTKSTTKSSKSSKTSPVPLTLPGLEALSTLSQLRGFKPGFVRRHFTIAELQWMKRHWAKLDQLTCKIVVPTTVLPPKHWLGTHWPTLLFLPSHCV